MTTTRRPLVRTAALVVTAALALVGCASDGGDRPAPEGGTTATASATDRAVPDDGPAQAEDGSGDAAEDDGVVNPADGGPDPGSSTASGPQDALGPGTVIGSGGDGPIDVGLADELLRDPDEAGAGTAVGLFLRGWWEGATTGETALLDLVSGTSCSYCASVAASTEATPLRPEDGYGLEMTVWHLGPPAPAGDAVVAEVALRVRTTFTQPLDDGTPHVHVLQDEAQVLRTELRWDGERWAVAGVASTPWGEV